MAERKQSPDGAYSLTNLRITTRYLDPHYEIEIHDLTRGETQLLKVFSLKRKDAQAPSFHARVDDGNPGRRKLPELDIDIQGVTPAIAKDFKAKRNGYAGHHTDRSPNQQDRIFEVKISVPSGTVFEGNVFFNAHFKMALQTTTYSTVGVTMTVNRAVPAPTEGITPVDSEKVSEPAPNWLIRTWNRVLKSLHIR
jgi:hypothetical protein